MIYTISKLTAMLKVQSTDFMERIYIHTMYIFSLFIQRIPLFFFASYRIKKVKNVKKHQFLEYINDNTWKTKSCQLENLFSFEVTS